MTKLFLKIPSVLRSLIMLVCAFGSYFLMASENTTLQVLGYILLGLMVVCLIYDRKAFKIEKAEREKAKRTKPTKAKVFVGKYPFVDTKDGYVLKWAYYNENIAGCRYLNVPYKDLKTNCPYRLNF